MKSYSEMSRDELARELEALRTSVQTGAIESGNHPPAAVDEMQGFLHELRVHQVELELQNRELREARQELEEWRSRYLDLYDFAPYGYLTFDDKGCIREINLTGAQMLGKERSYLIGKPFVAYISNGEASRFLEHIRRCRQGEANVTTDLVLEGDNARRVKLLSIPKRDGERRGKFFRAALIDISERKRAEEEANRNRAQLESVFYAIQDGIVVSDMEGNFLLINEAEARICGFPTVEAMKREIAFYKEVYELSYLDGKPLPFEAWPINRIFKGESIKDWELRARRRDTGEEWFLSYSGEPVRDEQGKQILAVVGTRDITERKRAEEALGESEAQAAGIIESAMDAIVTVDPGQRIVLFNPAAEQMFQCPAAEAIGQSLDRFIPQRFRHAHQQHIADFGQTNATRRLMGELGAVYGLRANGEEFPIEASISQIDAKKQKLFTIILRDITERQRNENRMQEQAAMLNQAREAILVRDLEDVIRFWNQGAERLYGWNEAEAIGRPVKDLLYRGDSSLLDQAIAAVIENGEWRGEVRHFTKDGRALMVEGHWTLIRDEQGKPKSILAINDDITEKKKLEQQFLRAQRLESIGTLASGIAHDLNNILSPITMGIQLLQMKSNDDGVRRLLDVIQQNAERGADLIKQVTSFARGAAAQKTTLQPNYLIKEIIKTLHETLPKNITVKQSLATGLAAVDADPTQLHQVMMNLCVNARDAMPEGGTLTIATENMTIDEHYARMFPDAKPGPYVMITVADTGVGIPREVIDRIFDPFFTMKEPGKGTGLGLATVLGIVKNHGGFINVYSEPGDGTKFRIYFPAIESAQTAQAIAAMSNLPIGHGETILVVDDEAHIREITRTALEAFGYRVLTANEGAEGVALYAMHQMEVAAVLTDMMMPFMDGPAMIRALQKINPQIKIIASSGLAEGEKAREAIALGVELFLSKPYTAESLLVTLDNLLRSGTRS